MQGHRGAITYIAFHPNSGQLVSGSDDQTIRLWDAVTGQLCQTLTDHAQGVTWQCLHVLRPEDPYAGMNMTGVTGITGAQKAALKSLGAVVDE